ncbi:MAG: hypothetical protein KGK44_00095 [Gammaproteobacteria bacterium]|nr:hypothetical protein [Gammaproteobacteria bacterium]
MGQLGWALPQGITTAGGFCTVEDAAGLEDCAIDAAETNRKVKINAALKIRMLNLLLLYP